MMKNIGIIRSLDDLGRMVIPAELRRNFEIKYADEVSFYLEDDFVVVSKENVKDGISRKVDELGRIVFPREYIKTLEDRASFEIFVENKNIYFRHYQVGCIFCGETKRLQRYKDKPICNICMEAIHDNYELRG